MEHARIVMHTQELSLTKKFVSQISVPRFKNLRLMEHAKIVDPTQELM
jgi:hypothetical protein